MGKKFKSVIAATMAVSTITPFAADVNAQVAFSDVKQNNSHYDAILQLAERKIISGYPDGTFQPGGSVTRGQAAKIIAGILGLDTTNVTSHFKDVSATYEHAGAINALYKANIISGYADETFKPGNPITRAQMAKILANAFNLQPSSTALPFTDVNLTGEFAPYIQALFGNNITKGTTATTYSPLANVTRGQLATFVVNAEKATQATAFTIDRIEQGVVYTSAGDFKVANTLAAVLSAENAAALKGATVTATTKANTITELTQIQLNTAGTATAPAIFNGNGIELAKLTVNADYVKLQNVNITGDMIVTGNVQSALSLVSTAVKGEITVQKSAALTASLTATLPDALLIDAIDSAIQKLNIDRNAVSVSSDEAIIELIVNEAVKQLELNADVSTLSIPKSDALTVTGDGQIDTVDIGEAKDVTLDVAAQIKKLVIQSLQTTVALGNNTTVDVAVIPDNAKLADVVPNAANKVANSQSSTDAAAGTPPTPTQPPATGGTPVAPPIIQMIASVQDVNIYLGFEQPFDLATDLPTEVQARMSDNTEKLVAVTWTVPADTVLDTTVAGELKLEGTVVGYTSKVNLTITVGPAKAEALEAAVAEANTLAATTVSVTGDDVLPTAQWTTAAALEALQAVIAEAAAVAASETRTYAQVGEAEERLAAAIAAFKETLKNGTTVDTTAAAQLVAQLLDSTITVADDAATVPYGVSFLTAAQDEARKAAAAAMQLAIDKAQADEVTKVAFDEQYALAEAAYAAMQSYLAENIGTKVDKAALGTLITTAKQSYVAVSTDGTDVIPKEKWTTAQAKADFTAAIDVAELEFTSAQSTPDTLTAAMTALKAALDAYEGVQAYGIAPATTTVEANVASLKTALATVIVADDAATVAYGENYVTTAEKAAIDAAVTAIEAVLAQAKTSEVTKQAFDAAEAAFNTAVALFEAAYAANVGTYVDTTALTTLITQIEASYVAVSADGTDVLPTAQWTTADAKAALQAAVAAAKAALPELKPADVEQATATLQQAFDTYKAAQQAGVTPSTAAVAVTLTTVEQKLATLVEAEQAADVNYGQNYITAAQKAAIAAAITEVKAAIAAAEANTLTKQAFDAAVVKFEAAVAAFEAAYTANTGTKIDTESLSKLVASAKAAIVAVSTDGKDVAPSAKWTTAAAKEALELAITAAEQLNPTTPEEAHAALEALQLAINAYEAAKQNGVTPVTAATEARLADVEQLVSTVQVADTAAEVAYGENYVTKAEAAAIQSALEAIRTVLQNTAALSVTANDFEAAASAFDAAADAFVAAASKTGTFVNKAPLQEDIAAAKAKEVAVSTDGKDVLPTAQWTTAAANQALKDAIATAQAEFDSAASTPASVADAKATLAAAVTRYVEAIQTGVKPSVAAASTKVATTKQQVATVIVAETAATVDYGKAYVTAAQKAAIEQAITAIEASIAEAQANALTAKDFEAAEAQFNSKVADFEAALATQKGTFVDKSALATDITEAEQLYNETETSVDGTDVPADKKWATAAQKAALKEAIDAAKVIAAKSDASDVEVSGAITALQQAIATFKQQQQAGKSIDTSALTAAIATAEGLLADTTVVVASSADDVPPSGKWVSQQEKDALANAVSAAQALLTTPGLTPAALNEALADLQAAINTYKAAIKQGSYIASSWLTTLNNELKAVEIVKTSADGTDVSSNETWTTSAALAAFNKVKMDYNNFVVAFNANVTLAQVKAWEKIAKDGIAAYEAAKKPGLKLVVNIGKFSVELTASEALNIYVGEEIVGTATLAKAATGDYELSFAPVNNVAFDETKLGNEFIFILDDVKFYVKKSTDAWQVSIKPLGKPTTVTAVNGSTLEISWDAVEGATGYNVFRIGKDNATVNLTPTGNVTKITDTTTVMGEDYKYVVQAVNKYATATDTNYVDVKKARMDVDGEAYSGNYIVISNESTDAATTKATGSFTKQKRPGATSVGVNNEALSLDAYGMSPVIPHEQLNVDSTFGGNLVSVEATSYKVGDKRDLFVTNTATGALETISVTLLATSNGANIWGGDANFTEQMAKDLAAEFDRNMLPVIKDNFGNPTDVDNNKKIDLVVYDIQDGYSGASGEGYINGYYRSEDLDATSYGSNGGEFLYLDTYPTMGSNRTAYDAKKVYSTVVHEFQHLINSVHEQQERISDAFDWGYQTTTWLDEGLSMAAEQLYIERTGEASYLENRTTYYNNQALAAEHSIIDFYGNNDTLMSYAMSYLFIHYLRAQVGDKVTTKQLFDMIYKHQETFEFDPATMVDEDGYISEVGYAALEATTQKEGLRAVEKVVQAYIDPNMTIGEFMTAFRIALVAQEASGLYGFNGKVMPKFNVKVTNANPNNLRGGAAVVLQLADDEEIKPTGAHSNVKYTGIYKKPIN